MERYGARLVRYRVERIAADAAGADAGRTPGSP
jgi:hypothetical protein